MTGTGSTATYSTSTCGACSRRSATPSTAPIRNARIAAWRAAVAEYRGEFAAGCDYEWIEPYREAVRQQYLDAALALADALDR